MCCFIAVMYALSCLQTAFDFLSGADVARVLLDCHRHVLAALPCPRHALQVSVPSSLCS